MFARESAPYTVVNGLVSVHDAARATMRPRVLKLVHVQGQPVGGYFARARYNQQDSWVHRDKEHGR